MDVVLGGPNGGFVPVTTFVSGVDRDGTQIEYGTYFMLLRANGVIAKGDVVSWVDPTATVPASVQAMPTASAALDFAGVAMEGATGAGKFIKVAIQGFCLVNVVAQTPAAGNYLVKPSVTAGKGIVASAALAATDIVGTIFGRFFGVKDANTTLASCFIRQY
jgi:hypothetical protein